MMWVLLFVCLVVSFIFSGIEAGIFSVNRVRLAHHVKKGEPAALILQSLLQKPDRLLITVIIVTNLANITALVFVTKKLVGWWQGNGYLIALAISLPMYLLGLELLPKSIFRRFPYRALALFAVPLRVTDALLGPMHFLGRIVQKVLFGARPPERQRMFIGREDFRYYAEQGEKTGALTKAEREMITNVVDFRGIVAREVMEPIDPTRCLPGTMSVREFLERSAKSPHDRWLVTDDVGLVTGVVSVFEVLLERRRDVNIGVYQRRIVTVICHEAAYSILRKLRAARSVIAVVRDTANAKPVGQISWEALIRTLVAAAGKQKIEAKADAK